VISDKSQKGHLHVISDKSQKGHLQVLSDKSQKGQKAPEDGLLIGRNM
jgi:hypothetical protein